MEQEKKEIAIIIDGKKYKYLKSKHDEPSEVCEGCALKERCEVCNGETICEVFEVESDNTSNFQLVGDATPAEHQTVTEGKAYDDYQERSTTANDRGELLAWAFIVLLAGMMIGNHCYLEFYVGAACGLAYLLLSMIQSAWQTIAIWIVKNRIKSDNLTIEDYPEWVGGWAWVFWYTKIGLLTLGTIYVLCRFVSLLLDL